MAENKIYAQRGRMYIFFTKIPKSHTSELAAKEWMEKVSRTVRWYFILIFVICGFIFHNKKYIQLYIAFNSINLNRYLILQILNSQVQILKSCTILKSTYNISKFKSN